MSNTLTPEQMTNVANLKYALLSGRYKQGTGCLNKRNEKYCCLGVAAEVAGLKILKVSDFAGVATYEGREGAELTIALDPTTATEFGLDKTITQREEKLVKKEYLTHENTPLPNRMLVLMQLNDTKYSFKDIVELIERLGWDE